MTFRTATTTANISGSLFQTAWTNALGEIQSFDGSLGSNEIRKYYDAATNAVFYKKILSPIMLFLSAPESGSPFTATVRDSLDGFNFDTVKTDAFGSDKFPLEHGQSKSFKNNWITLSSDYADSSRNRIHRSTDGVTWTTAYGNSTLVYLSHILLEANGRRFVEVEAGSSGGLEYKLVRSDDGITWTNGTTAIASGTRKKLVSYFDSKYLFINHTNTLYVSSNGGNSATGYTIGADTLGNSAKIIHSYVSGGNIYFFCQYTFVNVYFGYGNDTYYRVVSRTTAPSANSWTYTEVSLSPTYVFDGSHDWSSLANINTRQVSVGSTDLVCGYGGNDGVAYVVWDLSNITSGPRILTSTLTFDIPSIFYNKSNSKFYLMNRDSGGLIEAHEIGVSSLTNVSSSFVLDAGEIQYGYFGVCWKD